jgi:hypothetical protein
MPSLYNVGYAVRFPPGGRGELTRRCRGAADRHYGTPMIHSVPIDAVRYENSEERWQPQLGKK